MRRMRMFGPASFATTSSSSSSSFHSTISTALMLLLSSWTFFDTTTITTCRALAPPTTTFSSSRRLLNSRSGMISGGIGAFLINTSPRKSITSIHSSAAVIVDVDDIDGSAGDAPSSRVAYDDVPTVISSMDDVVDIAKFEHIASLSPPRAGAIMKMLPPETWEVSTPISLMYFAADVLAVVLSMSFLHEVVNSDVYESLPLAGRLVMVLPLQVLTGFAMWCTWCIGHDAGHGTVSKSKKYGNVINRIVGEVCHSVICLTPFVPWQLSHRKHHLHHNHIDRDYSHQWYVREQSSDLHPLITVAHASRILQLPFLYFFYLVAGVPDGGHVFFYGRMWDGHKLEEKADASLSVITSFVTSGCLWHAMGTHDFALVCMMPWMVMSFWLFMVTYLQHHSSDGKLYTDDTFTFERGAFETVDRNYGKWVNRMSHHMMDGHVVHHLFFTKVPHYRLEGATRALRLGMEELGMDGMYKRVDTPDYSQEIVRQFHDNWFFVDEDRVVR